MEHRILHRAGIVAGAAVLLAGAALVAQQQPDRGTPGAAPGHQGMGPDHIMLTPSEMAWTDGPDALPPGAKLAVIEGDPHSAGPFTMRLKVPAGYRIPAHTHPAIEHVTVLSGTLHMGTGDVLDKAKGKALPVGSFAVMPIGTRHFAWADEETVVQVHGIGPWGITYVNPADDPRNNKK